MSELDLNIDAGRVTVSLAKGRTTGCLQIIAHTGVGGAPPQTTYVLRGPLAPSPAPASPATE